MALNFFADGRLVQAGPQDNLLSAALRAQLDIPYFCWHPALGAVGSCRQCAVKLFSGPGDETGRIVMACMTRPTPGMRISVVDGQAAAFREAVVEMVLTNHPHDCPVCEVGGECHLQDMTVLTGHHRRRYHFPKRTHLNQDLGPLIRHEMNRCIGCYRCVRFYRDFAGGADFGVFGAARNIYFGREKDGPLQSNFAGNLVEVCPTGVFVDKPFSAHFRRKWDMRATPSVCPHCAVGCNITLHARGGFRRVTNRYNATLNGYFLCDRGRFGPGFLNSKARLQTPRLRSGGTVGPAAAQARLAAILAAGDVIGIGSARACLEANFALRTLVGQASFYGGFSAFDAAALAMALAIFRQMRPASLGQIAQADAWLVLGDDPALIAPRLALALRQAAQDGQPGRFMTAAPGWLDAVARRSDADGQAVLATAARPIVVASGDAAVLAQAANMVRGLRQRGVDARLSLLLPEANSVGLGMLDTRTLAEAAQHAGRHVIVLERDIAREPSIAARIFAAAKSVTVLDHIASPCAINADLAIGVASFAESDGMFVNLEGRVQRFSNAMESEVIPGWQVLRDAAVAAGVLPTTRWPSHAGLLEDLAHAVPELAACRAAWTGEMRTLPYRYSGRAAGFNAPVAAMTAEAPAPGCNSVQAQQRVATDRLDVFLFEDRAGEDFAAPDSPQDDRVLGIEELSSLSPAIIAYRAVT